MPTHCAEPKQLLYRASLGVHNGAMEHEATIEAQVETSLALSINAETEKDMGKPRSKNGKTTIGANVTFTLVASVLWLLSKHFKLQIVTGPFS